MLFLDYFFKWCFAALLALVATVFIGGILFAISVLFIDPPRHEKASRAVEASNLRQIAQASLIYASDNRDRLPNAVDLPDYARLLAVGGGLNDATIWFPIGTDLPENARTVLQEIPGKPREQSPLSPAFTRARPLFTVVIGGLKMDDPRHTPIAWTRGLDLDTGHWRADSPYGGEGGFIASLGGQVEFFSDLHKMPLVSRDGLYTHRIRDALPPGARISDDPGPPAPSPTLADRLRKALHGAPAFIRILITWAWPLWMLALLVKLTLAIARTLGVPVARVRIELRPRWLILAPAVLIGLSVLFQV